MLSQIQLENFKCFLNESIHLRNLNLLTGLNGMGKSTVIQSLLLLRQNYENGLLSLRRQLGLNGEYVNIGTSSDLLYKYFEKKEIAINLLTDTNEKFMWKWDASDSLDILPEILSDASSDLSAVSLFTNDFHYLNAERIGPRAYYETSTTKVIHSNQLGPKGEFAASYFVHNRDMEIPNKSLSFADGMGLTLYEQVNAWLSVIRPGTKVVVKEQPDAGIVSLHFEFVLGSDNPGSYKANNVGFGLTYIFPLIVSVLSSAPGSLLLLENPEAHIHPKGQAELGIFLAKASSGGVQIVVETHSDHILNGVRFAVKNKLLPHALAQCLFFTGSVIDGRFKHLIEYITINETGKISKRPNDFFDVWDNLLVKLV